MKTRSNMPLFVLECEDIKALSNSQIDLLRCGDYLVKKDASGEHAYKVTFKSDTGLCLTYHDASVIETQSYDKVDGNWVYNSEDKTIIAEPSFENIVDKDGHSRFVDGDLETTTIEGITPQYAKWSLSGSHLLIVYAFDIASETTLTSNQTIAFANIPEWIFNKIKPIFAGVIANYEGLPLYADDFSSQSSGFNVRLGDSGKPKSLAIRINAPITLDKNRHGRIAIDYLIDNE